MDMNLPYTEAMLGPQSRVFASRIVVAKDRSPSIRVQGRWYCEDSGSLIAKSVCAMAPRRHWKSLMCWESNQDREESIAISSP